MSEFNLKLRNTSSNPDAYDKGSLRIEDLTTNDSETLTVDQLSSETVAVSQEQSQVENQNTTENTIKIDLTTDEQILADSQETVENLSNENEIQTETQATTQVNQSQDQADCQAVDNLNNETAIQSESQNVSDDQNDTPAQDVSDAESDEQTVARIDNTQGLSQVDTISDSGSDGEKVLDSDSKISDSAISSDFDESVEGISEVLENKAQLSLSRDVRDVQLYADVNDWKPVSMTLETGKRTWSIHVSRKFLKYSRCTLVVRFFSRKIFGQVPYCQHTAKIEQAIQFSV